MDHTQRPEVRSRNPSATKVLRIAVAVLWFVSAYLGLLLAERVQTRWIAAHNPYIAATLAAAPWPRPLPGALPENLDLRAASAQWQSSLDTTSAASDWEIPSNSLTPEERSARRALFPGLSEEERTRYAIANDETVLRFDSRGHLIEVYSDSCTRRSLRSREDARLSIAALRDQIYYLQPSPPMRTVSVPITLPGRPSSATEAAVLIEPSGDHYVFLSFDYACLKAAEPNLPNDSRWDIYALRYKPNLTGLTRPFPFSSNKYGFRAPDVEIPKPPNVFRILCIGGSTTHEGPDNDSTYPALVQKRLQALFPGARIEVLNCGIEGIRTRSQFLRLPDFLELQPDLIVAYEGINDVANDVQEYWESSRPFPYNVVGGIPLLGYYMRPLFWPQAATYRSWIRGFTIANLECFRGICARRGIRLALCSNAYPDFDRLPRDQRQYYATKWYADARIYSKLLQALNQEILAYCASAHLLYIPVSENVQPTIDYLGDFCHMNTPGIALKAEIVAQALTPYIRPAVEALH